MKRLPLWISSTNSLEGFSGGVSQKPYITKWNQIHYEPTPSKHIKWVWDNEMTGERFFFSHPVENLKDSFTKALVFHLISLMPSEGLSEVLDSVKTALDFYQRRLQLPKQEKTLAISKNKAKVMPIQIRPEFNIVEE
ncbi:MAG: hypothetical protein JNN15_00770 [Blastocatellia bacterium]|nr:hypothetical protein [Blastocatellia bacterium]